MASDLREAPPDDPLERSLPGSRYGIVLLLLLATFVFMAAGFSGSWVPLVTVSCQGRRSSLRFQAAGVGHRIGVQPRRSCSSPSRVPLRQRFSVPATCKARCSS